MEKKADTIAESKKPIHDQIKEFQDELVKTPYNKRTQHHIGLVKAKIAKLKEKIETRARQSKKGEGYSVKKTNDGTVVIVGFPSVGKSTLLNALTNANSPVAAYEFTTLTVIPGLMEYKHAKIQILDIPGIVHGAASGRGRGKEVLGVMRSADMLLIIMDVFHPEHYRALINEIFEAGIRINQQKPEVKVTKRAKDGIRIGNTVPLTKLTRETIQAIFREFKYSNAEVLIREDITDDQLIDIINGNRVYMPAIILLNKIDAVAPERLQQLQKAFPLDLSISAETKQGISELKELIFTKLKLMKVYLKEPQKEADLKVPLIIKQGATIKDVCQKLHKEFIMKFKFARVWGSSRFPGQRLLRTDYVLHDNDILELHLK